MHGKNKQSISGPVPDVLNVRCSGTRRRLDWLTLLLFSRPCHSCENLHMDHFDFLGLAVLGSAYGASHLCITHKWTTMHK